MKTMLQSLVKIIIIGSLNEQIFVLCNRQFYSAPPLPYYQNDGYYYPDIPTYGEPSPPFYNVPNGPPPPPSPNSYNVPNVQNIPNAPTVLPPHNSYNAPNVPNVPNVPNTPPLPPNSYNVPNVPSLPPNSYTNYYGPAQLFHQNENYQPPQGLYPQIPPNDRNFPPSMIPPQGMYIDYPQMNPLFSTKDMSNQRPLNVPQQQETKFYNIVEKEKDFQPYYHDEYNKNYQEDEYDNYNDDDQSDPCGVSYPYQYFEASRKNPNLFGGNILKQYAPCNPQFQPDFRGKIYSIKAPITILPSRFPPKIEEIIERIQNYFSTYTQQGIQNPLNSSLPSSATNMPSTTITNSESDPSEVTSPTTDLYNENATGENEASVETNPDQSETTVNAVVDAEQVTEKTEVTTEMNNEIISTTEDPHMQMEPQMESQSAQEPSLVMAEVPNTTETVTNFSPEEGEHGVRVMESHPVEESPVNDNSPQQPIHELDQTYDKTTEAWANPHPENVEMVTENGVAVTEPMYHETEIQENGMTTQSNGVFTTERS